jgi:hypothetical protein
MLREKKFVLKPIGLLKKSFFNFINLLFIIFSLYKLFKKLNLLHIGERDTDDHHVNVLVQLNGTKYYIIYVDIIAFLKILKLLFEYLNILIEILFILFIK